MPTTRLNKLFDFIVRIKGSLLKSKRGVPASLPRNQAGFTLIEVLVALGIVGFVLGGIYAAYTGQLRSFNTQEQVVDMQQNIRVATYFLERELRLAGLDPTGNAGAGFVVAAENTIQFTMDFTGGEGDGIDNDGDGSTDEPDEAEWHDGSVDDANEDVTYALSNDANGNGFNDGLVPDSGLQPTVPPPPCNLLRNGQVIAANIDALNFTYLGVNPNDATCGENSQWGGTTTNNDPRDIRTVQITIVARAGATVRTLSRNFTNNTTYMSQPPFDQAVLAPQNDNFRRVRITTSVRCRNMGL